MHIITNNTEQNREQCTKIKEFTKTTTKKENFPPYLFIYPHLPTKTSLPYLLINTLNKIGPNKVQSKTAQIPIR